MPWCGLRSAWSCYTSDLVSQVAMLLRTSLMLQHDSRVVFSASKVTAQSWVSLNNALHFSLACRLFVWGDRHDIGSREGTELGSGDLTSGPADAVTRHFLIYESVRTRWPGILFLTITFEDCNSPATKKKEENHKKMETQLTGINGKTDTVSDETVMMDILSLIHARKQTVRLRFCAPASESYGGSSRPHFENPWVGLSGENYSSPLLAWQLIKFPNQQGSASRISPRKMCVKIPLCRAQNPVPTLEVLSHSQVHSSPCAFIHVYFIFFSLEADVTGMEIDL